MSLIKKCPLCKSSSFLLWWNLVYLGKMSSVCSSCNGQIELEDREVFFKFSAILKGLFIFIFFGFIMFVKVMNLQVDSWRGLIILFATLIIPLIILTKKSKYRATELRA